MDTLSHTPTTTQQSPHNIHLNSLTEILTTQQQISSIRQPSLPRSITAPNCPKGLFHFAIPDEYVLYFPHTISTADGQRCLTSASGNPLCRAATLGHACCSQRPDSLTWLHSLALQPTSSQHQLTVHLGVHNHNTSSTLQQLAQKHIFPPPPPASLLQERTIPCHATASCPSRTDSSTQPVCIGDVVAIAPWFLTLTPLLILSLLPLCCCCCCVHCLRCTGVHKSCPCCCCLCILLSLILGSSKGTPRDAATTNNIYFHTTGLLDRISPTHHDSITACIAQSQNLPHSVFMAKLAQNTHTHDP